MAERLTDNPLIDVLRTMLLKTKKQRNEFEQTVKRLHEDIMTKEKYGGKPSDKKVSVEISTRNLAALVILAEAVVSHMNLERIDQLEEEAADAEYNTPLRERVGIKI